MITVIKLNPLGEAKVRYQGEVAEHLAHGLIIQASWQQSARDLGYTRFEPGDRFIEYYYTDRWFNIFDISTAGGTRKGWYCNITVPARIYPDHIEHVRPPLIVSVGPHPSPLIL